MLGLNAVALVFFGCIYVAAYQLCKRPEGRRRKTVRTLCAVLLCGNLLRYCVVYPFVKGVVMLPVEFSTVAYFAVPMILLTGRKKLHSWAAFSAGIKSSTANFPPPGPEAAEQPPNQVKTPRDIPFAGMPRDVSFFARGALVWSQ